MSKKVTLLAEINLDGEIHRKGSTLTSEAELIEQLMRAGLAAEITKPAESEEDDAVDKAKQIVADSDAKASEIFRKAVETERSLIETAEVKADELTTEAEVKAKETVAAATAEADKILADAKEAAAKIIAEAKASAAPKSHDAGKTQASK